MVSTSGGGQPGDGAKLRIRGIASINASAEPLYVVDGMPFDGELSSINPNDIESMTVLKDASSGALYGARGANGVVIITTKRGQEGKPKINFKANWGWSSRGIKKYDMVGQEDYMQLVYEANRNKYVYGNKYEWNDAVAQSIKEMPSKIGGEIYNPFKNYTAENLIDPTTEKIRPDAVSAWDEDWMDEVTENNALRQEYQFSVTGGNEYTQTLLSLGYLKDKGILKNTGFERFSGRLSVDYNAKSWFKTGLSSSFASTKQDKSTYEGSSNANVWYSAQFIAPIYPAFMKDANGKDLLDANGKRQLDYGQGRPKLSNFSPIGTLYDDKEESKYDNLSARTYLTFGSDDEDAGILQGLKLNINLGADYTNRNRMIYYNMHHGNFASSDGLLSKYSTKTFSYTFNQLLTYNRKLNDHSFDVLAGHESYSYEYNYLYGSKTGLVEGIYELAPATNVRGTSSYTYNYKIESYLARLNYNYKERYYFSASYRTDGSSRFHKDHRWGNFWSVGGNWRASEEEFLKQYDWLDNLSLRASYGIQGNDNILDSDGNSSYYLWQSFYDLTYPNATYSGAVLSSFENKQISWEENANFNVGLEARIFNRFDIGFEYYNRKTTDMLLVYPMALSTGFTGYNSNIGDIRNSGFEISLGAQIINRPNFTWRTTLLGSVFKNKVLKLTNESPEIISGVRSIKVGSPINTFYMAKAAGVDPDTGAQLYWAYESMDDKGNVTGEYITDDYSKAATSKYYLGSRIPDFSGSIGFDFTFFKDFDLAILATYSIGGKIYDSKYLSSMNTMYDGDTWNKDILKRWQKPGDITDIPRVEVGGTYTTTDRFLQNASYLSLKNITAGYTLPKGLLTKANIQSLRIFCTADNLFMLTHLNGMDPQFNFAGGTDYTYMPNKTISIGLDINF